jgi:hypothetical protein
MDNTKTQSSESLVDVLISEHEIEKICTSRASQNNSNARTCEEPERLRASDLLDLYYKQQGRCCCCAVALTTKSIQLDHIVEANHRAKLAAVIARQPHSFGPSAAISNVQWICKTCNSVKETCRRHRIELTNYVNAVAVQASNGFPIRKAISVTGAFKTKSELRADALKKLFDRRRQSLTVREACEAIHGTEYDCCSQLVAKELRRIGWRGASWRASQKVSLVFDVVSSTASAMRTKKDWWRLVNEKMVETIESSICFVRFCQIVDDNGIQLAVRDDAPAYRPKASLLRAPCSQDRAAVLFVAKEAGVRGMAPCDIIEAVVSDNKPEQIVVAAIDELVEAGRLQQAVSGNGALVYAADSKEAAEIIGVSLTRLKKWATRNWDGCEKKPEFFKASDKPKGHRFYALDKLHEFVASRTPHRLDLSVAGKRESCVNGGSLGGRPKQRLFA